MTLVDKLSRLVLFAADAKPAAPDADAVPQSPFNPLVLIAIFAAFYFIMLRPKQREEQQRRKMLTEIKDNDRVVTIGGIHGVVTNVNRQSDVATIRIDESTGTKIRVNLSAISRVGADEDKKEGAAS